MTTGPMENLCCKPLRGYDPVETAGECLFVEARAQKIVDFFQTALRHIEGEVAGKPFWLEDWQKWTLGNLFGWERPDGTRRYREAFIYVPRKNGKTPLCAGIVLYMTAFDGEPGAQVYSAAAEREQAALVYRHAQGMVLQHPVLARQFKTLRTQKLLEHHATGSTYRALSADANTKHGLNAHCIIVDELHAHRDGDLVHTLETSMASRRQPLVVHITTADFYRESICNQKYDYAVRVRDGAITDEGFLPLIYEAASDADWTDPGVWSDANPNLSVSVKANYLARECEKAKAEPSYLNTFLRLHLNVRTNADVAWLDMGQWDACDAEPEPAGPCYFGLDLAKTTDQTALAAYWPETHSARLWYWIPEETAHKAEQRDQVPYTAWTRDGLIERTHGNVTDYAHIGQRVMQITAQYDAAEVAFDPWNATQLATELMGEGLGMVEFRQGYRSMSEPAKELERLVVSRQLRHGGNKVLRWNASNVMVEMDPSGNIKPSKRKSTGRIDGIVALAMAIGRAINTEQAGPSVYETRGLLTL